MKKAFYFICVLSLSLLYGCAISGRSSKFSFIDGYYRAKLNDKKYRKYYIVTGTDSVKVYRANKYRQISDTAKSISFLFPPHLTPDSFSKKIFKTGNFDLDIISVIFKYRPALKEYPAQLNTNFNGALYAGFRKDVYDLYYNTTPLHSATRQITHHGFSIGWFVGLGSSRIDEFVTLSRINYEYDGVVMSTGIASEINLDKINFVLLSGLDFLTDRNHNVWVNNRKIWVGAGIGLNLN